jgi:hypothetical protein
MLFLQREKLRELFNEDNLLIKLIDRKQYYLNYMVVCGFKKEMYKTYFTSKVVLMYISPLQG